MSRLQVDINRYEGEDSGREQLLALHELRGDLERRAPSEPQNGSLPVAVTSTELRRDLKSQPSECLMSRVLRPRSCQRSNLERPHGELRPRFFTPGRFRRVPGTSAHSWCVRAQHPDPSSGRFNERSGLRLE